MLNEGMSTIIGVGVDGESVLMVGKDDFSFERVDVDVVSFHVDFNYLLMT